MAQKMDDPRKIHKVGNTEFYDFDGYLDPKILTEKTAVSKKNPEGKISFKADSRIIDALTNVGGQDIRTKTPDEFGDVVKAFVTLRTGEGSPHPPLSVTGNKGANFEDFMNIGRATTSKYLKLAEIAGIFDPKSVKQISGEREDLSKKSLSDLDEFRKDPLVADYLKANEKHREENNPQYLYRLFKALKIMGLTPYQMAAKGKVGQSNEQKVEWIKDQLERLKTWSEDPDAIDPIQPTKKRKLNPKQQYNPDGQDKNNATMYQFVKSIRAFIKTNGISLTRQSATSRLSGKTVSHGFHSEQTLSYDQILKMILCLQTPVKEIKVPVLFKGHWVDWASPYKTVETFTKNYDYKSFWHDALMYFLIAIEMGMRAEEGFTIIAEKPTSALSSGVTEKKKTKQGVPIPKDENGNFQWYISLYTRKTEDLSAEDKIHRGRVSNPLLIEMIKKRRADIDAGHGIVKSIQLTKKAKPTPNPLHSLIGADDKYTIISTIDKSDSKTKSGTRPILRDIIRHCYLEAVPKEDRDETFDNFMNMPLHSLRHVFAQYWLHKSNRNYTFVAQLGHWKTENELKESYGGVSEDIFNEEYEIFSRVDARLSPKEIRAKLMNPQSAPSKAVQKEEIEQTKKDHPPIEKLTSTEITDNGIIEKPPVPTDQE